MTPTLSLNFANTRLEFSREFCDVDGVVLRVTRNGNPLGEEEHRAMLAAARQMSKEGYSDQFEEAWELQLATLGLVDKDCVVVLFEGTIVEGPLPSFSSESVRQAHCVFRRLAFRRPYWVPTPQMVALQPPRRVKRRA